jgi:molybdate transport system substrate-binding protein
MFKFNKYFAIILLAIFMAVSVIGCTGEGGDDATNGGDVLEPTDTLMVYSGAGLRKPMDEIGEVFEEEFNIRIEYSYAGSAQNLSQIELTGTGDVYMPGAKMYGQQAVEKGLAEDNIKEVAYHIPVIAVPQGNPAGIEKLEDLAKPGVKVVLGDPEAAAIGKTSVKIFKENGLKEAVDANTVATAPTVNEVLVYVAMKQCDAAIIWEDNVVGVEDVEAIPIAEEQNDIKTLPIMVLKSSEKSELAQKFVDFVAGPEGKAIYENHGFKIIE